MRRSVPRSMMWLALLTLALGQAVAEGNAPAESAPPAAPANNAATGGETAPIANPATGAGGTGAAQAAGAKVAILPIDGMIHHFTSISLERRAQRAIDDGCTIIVLSIDTPGGYLDTALEISRFIKSLDQVETIAWVNQDAYSAGSLIAAACDSIIMAPQSRIGDTAPVGGLPGQTLGPTERAKALSPLLKEFEDSATRNGYSYDLFKGMCVIGVKLYLVKHKQSGELRVVNEADFQIMVHGESPQAGDSLLNRIMKPLLGGTDDPVKQFATPRINATDADRGEWELVKLVHDGTGLLTMTEQEAADVGLSRNSTIRSDADLQQMLAAGSVQRYHNTWSEVVADFLTRGPVRAVLVLLFVIGLVIEMIMPGTGIGGIVAVICLVLLMGAPFLIGLAEVWHLVLFVVGLILLGVELFVIPGFGIFGVGGILCMFIGLVLAVVPTPLGGGLPSAEATAALQASLLWTVLGLIGGGIATFFLMRHFGTIPLFDKLMLRAEQRPVMTGAGATYTQQRVSGDESVGEGAVEVGDEGILITDLRPVGRMDLDGQIVDVVSSGAFLSRGDTVRVAEVHGNRIVVEPA